MHGQRKELIDMLSKIIGIAKEAGGIILKYYNNLSGVFVHYKEDHSPLTTADLQSNQYITENLKKNFNFPVISEEFVPEYAVRKNFQTFWLVDPLDGTKDFLAKTGQFTVNIALIEGGIPTLGVIYVPATDLLYYAQKGSGTFLNGKPIYNFSTRKQLIATDSVFHSSIETQEFLKTNGITQVLKFGSALKFGKLAEGVIDIYPRFEGSKEWDIAAGHIILKEAGCSIVDIVMKQEPVYNKPSMKNNFFIAAKKNILDRYVHQD